MSFHSKASLHARHPPHNWEYADAPTRLAATGYIRPVDSVFTPFLPTDIGKIAWQQDNDSFWMLKLDSPVTWIPFGGGAGFTGRKSFLVTYTDTVNEIIGPLPITPLDADEVDLFVFTGGLQEPIQDFTVREVIGGTVPGYYVCVGTASSAPGGGAFAAGSNPGTGISAILASGDKVRIIYTI